MYSRHWAISVLSLVGLMLTWPVLSLDPELKFYQYQFAYPPSDAHLDSDVVHGVQDHNGFLWLATGRGLIRFDGVESTVFRTSVYPELLSNNPTHLFIDSRNHLYIASTSGISKYDGEKFSAIMRGIKTSAHIRAIAEDSDRNLWFGSAQGLWVFDGKQLIPKFAGKIEQVRSLHWHKGKMYVGSLGKLFTVTNYSVFETPLPEALSEEQVFDLTMHQGRLWGATHAGMFTLDGQTIAPVAAGDAGEFAISILLSDRDDNLWFAGDRAIGRFLPNGELEIPDVADEDMGWVPQFTAMIEDQTGVHWHLSRYFGMTGLMDSPVRRISYTEGLPSSDVTAMTENADGKVFVATNLGISALTGESIERVLDENFDRSGRVQSLLVDDSQRLWVGTNKGLRSFDLEKSSWLDDKTDTAITKPINALVFAQGDNELWVGTDQGLYRIAGDIHERVLDSDGLDMSIESLTLDDEGTLWIGTELGLASLRDGTLEFHAVELPAASAAIVSIAPLSGGDLIAATSNQGILVKRNNQWKQYGEPEGMPAEKLIHVEVRNEHLWLITGGGVFRTPMSALDNTNAAVSLQPIVTQKRYRSLHNSYCCRGTNRSSVLVASGVLVAATDDGLITYDLDATDDVGQAPQPYIKTIELENKLVPFDAQSVLELNKGHDRVQINYSALALLHGSQLEFRYRLRGLDERWINVGDARIVHLQNLPPGEFTFELQASALPDLWSPLATTLKIKRFPSFTESTAFRALLWCSSLVCVLGLIWLRSAAARHRHKQLEARIRQRTRALRNINGELAQANSDLRRASETDVLTGLVNRRYFDTRHNDTEFSENLSGGGVLIMMDIDHFKSVNDTYGHAAGDEILRQFADVLRSVTRQSDLVARWGGEEFLMLCRCQGNETSLMLNRILQAVRDHRFTMPDGLNLNVSASFGAIGYPLWPQKKIADRLPLLLEFADAALYVVKSQGRDGWALLTSDTAPKFDVQVRRVGPFLEQFVADGQLLWQASRNNIAPASAESTEMAGSHGK